MTSPRNGRTPDSLATAKMSQAAIGKRERTKRISAHESQRIGVRPRGTLRHHATAHEAPPPVTSSNLATRKRNQGSICCSSSTRHTPVRAGRSPSDRRSSVHVLRLCLTSRLHTRRRISARRQEHRPAHATRAWHARIIDAAVALDSIPVQATPLTALRLSARLAASRRTGLQHRTTHLMHPLLESRAHSGRNTFSPECRTLAGGGWGRVGPPGPPCSRARPAGVPRVRVARGGRPRTCGACARASRVRCVRVARVARVARGVWARPARVAGGCRGVEWPGAAGATRPGFTIA